MSWANTDFIMRDVVRSIGSDFPSTTITDEGGGTMRLAVPSTSYIYPGGGFTADVVGKYVTVRGAANAGNDGVFPITAYDSVGGIWVEYTNASGVAEVSPLLWEIRTESTAYDLIRQVSTLSGYGDPLFYKWPHGTPPLTGAQLTNHGTNCLRAEVGATLAQSYFTVADRNLMGGSAISVRACVRGTHANGPVSLLARSQPTFPKYAATTGSPNAAYMVGYKGGTNLYVGAVNTSSYPYNYFAYGGGTPGTMYITGPAISYAINNWYGLRMDVLTQGPNVRLMYYVLQGYVECDKLFSTAPWVLVGNIMHVNGTVTPYAGDMPPGYTFNTGNFYSATPFYTGRCGFVLPHYCSTGVPNAYIESFQARRMPA